MAGAFQGDLNETPDFCGDYPFGTLHRRSPSLSCHDDIYTSENMAKSITASTAIPEGPEKMAMMKEMGGKCCDV